MTEETPESGTGRERHYGMIVVIGILCLSAVLALNLAYQYTSFQNYVAATLFGEEADPVWDHEALSVEECVDESMRWARECPGIKTLCDEYVNYVIARCLQSQDREAYCEGVAAYTGSTEFGYEECQARGVRRNVDAESCANSYRAIDAYCAHLSGEAPPLEEAASR